jgi:hypothetical protein
MPERRDWRHGAALVSALTLLGCGRAAAPLPLPTEHDVRSVLEPTRLGWVSSERPSGALPSAIGVGGKASGRVLLYLEFVVPPEPRRLLRAELVLGASGAAGTAIDVELSRAEAVRGELGGWSDQPRVRYPRLSARLATQASPQRLDVTELLRAETKPGEPLRLLLRAEPGEGEPVLIETGAAGGATPRLEAYWE